MIRIFLLALLCILNLTLSWSQTAYIANNSAGNVAVLDIETETILTTIAVGGNPLAVALDTTARRVYVTNTSLNSVSVINADNNTLEATINVGIFPSGITFVPSLSKLYVGNQIGNTVSVINTITNTVEATLDTPSPFSLMANHDGTRVYISSRFGNAVTVLDPTTDMVITTIPVGLNTRGIVVSPDNNVVYICGYDDGTVSVIDANTNTVTETIPTGNNTQHIAINSDGTTVYSCSFTLNQVKVINTADNTVTATILVGSRPYGIDVSSDDATVLVNNFFGNSVSVINPLTNTVSTTISGFSGPVSSDKFIMPPGPPVGDVCDTAIDISPQFGAAFNEPQLTDLFDNTEFTAGSTDPTPGMDCFFEDDPFDNTGYFSFTGDGSTYRIRSVQCAGSDANLNLQAAIYTGTCADLTQVDCNEDEDGNGGILNFNFEFETEEGVEYLLLVDGYQGETGAFCIEITNLTEPVGVTALNNTDLRVFPNPTTDLVQLPQIELERVEVYDATGRLILSRQSPVVSIDLSTQPVGLYLFKLYSSEQVYSVSVLKE